MAVMSAIFKGVDELSSIFDKMTSSGEAAVEQWESAGNIADRAFSQATAGAESMAQASQQATAATDHWTQAIGNYDKSAMDAIYSTEELVDMGFRPLRHNCIARSKRRQDIYWKLMKHIWRKKKL